METCKEKAKSAYDNEWMEHQLKKDIGAFYTPMPYARKAGELVMKAVERVPDGNDYIILDRTAGTGNLEAGLDGLKDRNGDTLLSHCIVSTYDYREYKILSERIGRDVRNVIAPIKANVCLDNGKLSNSDALSEDYINNPIIKKYIDDEKCTVILFENPPYRDDVSDNSQKRSDVKVREPYVQQEFKKVLPTLPNSNISTARDLSNQFIWSGFNYYLRQPTDSYILFSPIKYWKSLGLACKKFEQGYLFNRNHFHASASALACILWVNEDDDNEKIIVPAFDIKDESLLFIKDVVLQKCHNAYSVYFDKTKRSNDMETSVYFEYSGYEALNRKCDGKSYCSDDIIGYLRTDSFSIDAKHVGLVRGTLYGIRGFYLRRENYLRFLPLFAGKTFSQENWYDRDVYFTTSDGGDAYTHDPVFLKRCLIYTCLSNQNKCLSFTGSDGRYYRNELCLDVSNGRTIAAVDLDEMLVDCPLDDEEQELLDLWFAVLKEAGKTDNYNPSLTYGVYQITRELNTSHKENGKVVYDYPQLNNALRALRKADKKYWETHIREKLCRYELLK